MPVIEQVFVGSDDTINQDDFEKKLYLIRKSATKEVVNDPAIEDGDDFYVCSLSSRIIVYKGMLATAQLPEFYDDLRKEDFVSHLAMVHSRFSTNTLPALSLIHI